MDDGIIAICHIEARVRSTSSVSFDDVTRAVRWSLERVGTVPTSRSCASTTSSRRRISPARTGA